MVSIGSIVLRVDDVRRQAEFWAAALSYVPREEPDDAAGVSLNMMWMDFGRPHKSLADPYPRTPAMAAGVADDVWTFEEIAALLD